MNGFSNESFRTCKDVSFKSCSAINDSVDVEFYENISLDELPIEDHVDFKTSKTGNIECGKTTTSPTISQVTSIVKQDTVKEHEGRGNWSNQAEFFLSCLAYAVGIGNVWRFPYICYKNGGGVFLIPYMVMLFLAALPMFYMELALGQFAQLGPNKVYGKLSPLFRGLGYGMLLVTVYVAVYYNMIIAWSLFYTFASFTAQLGWENCGNWFNTPDCFSPGLDHQCKLESGGRLTWWNNSCVDMEEFCQGHGGFFTNSNNSQCYKSDGVLEIRQPNKKLPSEEYFRRFMLLMKDDTDFSNFGVMNWKLTGCLLLAWMLVLVCLIKGVKSAGRVVWFTALFPYVVLVLLLIRGATLPGAEEGVKFFITPEWSRLLEVQVWTDAATQIFYSLGPGFGGLVTLASYNKRDHNCQRDAVVIALANCATSIFAGFVIFSILGFMAKELGVPVGEVVEGGIGLAFVAYPTAVTKLPLAPLWSFLFFTMLLTLGLDSQFTMVETVITAVYDEWPALRKHNIAIVGGVCLGGFLLGLPMCLPGGFYLFVLLDHYAASWSLLLLAILEVSLVGWVYGAKNFHEDIASMGIKSGRWVKAYWIFCWRFVTPVLLLTVLVSTFVKFKPASEGDYMFPLWANALGMCISVSSILILIPFLWIEVRRALKKNQPLSFLLEPDQEWVRTSSNLALVASTAHIVIPVQIPNCKQKQKLKEHSRKENIWSKIQFKQKNQSDSGQKLTKNSIDSSKK